MTKYKTMDAQYLYKTSTALRIKGRLIGLALIAADGPPPSQVSECSVRSGSYPRNGGWRRAPLPLALRENNKIKIAPT